MTDAVHLLPQRYEADADLTELVEWPHNPRDHARAAIRESIGHNGFVGAILVQASSSRIIAGHGRRQDLLDNGTTAAPVIWIDCDDDTAARLVLALNGTEDQAGYRTDDLSTFLESMAATPAGLAGTTYSDDALQEMRASLEASTITDDREDTIAAAKDYLHPSSIDLFYTCNAGQMSKYYGVTKFASERQLGPLCCAAMRCGWQYGVRSTDLACHTAEVWARHHPNFIDNNFHEYDHRRHLAVIAYWEPRYTTVRDIMTPAQCDAAGIEFYSFGQIMEWAAELNEHAENVIVIPKTLDAIDKIPEQYMLGYSVPSTYGGTPLPTEAFKGRRVHLLGGSPAKQLGYWQKLKDEVVSLDNNYLLNISRYGSVLWSDGIARAFNDLTFRGAPHVPQLHVASVFSPAVIMSLAVMASWFNHDTTDDDLAGADFVDDIRTEEDLPDE